jgi:hypothetical protein
MKKEIVEKLQAYRHSYKREYDLFPFKQDPAAVFEHECKFYLNPIIEHVLPLIMEEIDQKKDVVESYYPYILEHYQIALKKEIDGIYEKRKNYYKKLSYDIFMDYSRHVMKYQKGTLTEKNQFISIFLQKHQENILEIAKKDGLGLLKLIGNIRTPKIQYAILQEKEIQKALRNQIQVMMEQNPKFDLWLSNYFCYPRTRTLSEYMDKFLGNEKIHIKFAKDFFENNYEKAKIILKNIEKNNEKRNYIKNSVKYE